MPAPTRTDPYLSFNFRVEIDGITSASFQEVSGLEGSIDVIEFREGGDSIVRKLPGLTRYANILLKRGLTDSRELWDWWQEGAAGGVQRRNASVVLLDRERAEVARWNVFAAWPVRYVVSVLDAERGAVAIETLELAHEGLERA
jgi:phage tail-like protein